MAVKLEKEMNTTNKHLVEEIEKENAIGSNLNELEFICRSTKNNVSKYYSIKHLQVLRTLNLIIIALLTK